MREAGEKEAFIKMSDKKMKAEILNAIAQENYEAADCLLQNYQSENRVYDDTVAILDAGIGEYYGDRERIWEAVRKGLMFNCRNYELYVVLGNYYLCENPYLTYLCYENALFYCGEPEDRDEIEKLLCQLEERHGIFVNKTTVIVLSYGLLEHTKLCIESIRATTTERMRAIIVVDQDSKDGSVEWLREQRDIVLVENKEDTGFSAGCNQGISLSADGTDIFLLDNDTILTENALFWLRMGLYTREDNGMAGSMSNTELDEETTEGSSGAENLFSFGEQNNRPMRFPYKTKIFLSNLALLIRRSVFDRVGWLDEDFRLTCPEDADYGLRMLKAGYRNIQCNNSFVVHFDGKAGWKETAEYQAACQYEVKKLNEKWGFNTEYYLGARLDLPQMIREATERSMRILEIGCGCGALMAYLKGRYPNAEMYGIELVPEVAEIAASMGNVLCGNVEEMGFPWEEEWFDYIIMGDVLEHLMDPENVLVKLRTFLKTNGYIIGSMPNVKHYSVLIPLLKHDVFSYGDSGILDRTHVKMYTGLEIRRLIMRSGYKMEEFCYKAISRPDQEEEAIIDMLSTLSDSSSRDTFLAYQYLFKAAKSF